MSDPIQFTSKLKGSAAVARLLNRFPEKISRTMLSLVKQEARGMAVEIARNTRPYGFSEKARKRGEKAVAKDINKVFASRMPNLIEDRLCELLARPHRFLIVSQRNHRFLARNGDFPATMAVLWELVAFPHARQQARRLAATLRNRDGRGHPFVQKSALMKSPVACQNPRQPRHSLQQTNQATFHMKKHFPKKKLE